MTPSRDVPRRSCRQGMVRPEWNYMFATGTETCPEKHQRIAETHEADGFKVDSSVL